VCGENITSSIDSHVHFSSHFRSLSDNSFAKITGLSSATRDYPLYVKVVTSRLRREPVLSMWETRGRKSRILLVRSMTFAIALCGTHLPARSAAVETGPEIAVLVDGRGLLPESLIWEAEFGTAGIFKHAGLRVRWTGEKRPGTPDCPRVITVAIATAAPDHMPPGVLAATCLRTGSINVYYDRIAQAMQARPKFGAALLSNIFAHEIAHVLQSVNRHSDTGILKAHWSRDDFLMMLNHQLAFTPLDVALIRAGATSSCRSSGGTD
jgi:hypothetical protein